MKNKYYLLLSIIILILISSINVFSINYPFEIELGNISSLNTTQVWNDANFGWDDVYHFSAKGGGSNSSTGLNNLNLTRGSFNYSFPGLTGNAVGKTNTESIIYSATTTNYTSGAISVFCVANLSNNVTSYKNVIKMGVVSGSDFYKWSLLAPINAPASLISAYSQTNGDHLNSSSGFDVNKYTLAGFSSIGSNVSVYKFNQTNNVSSFFTNWNLGSQSTNTIIVGSHGLTSVTDQNWIGTIDECRIASRVINASVYSMINKNLYNENGYGNIISDVAGVMTINISSLPIGFPFVINGSNGVTINNSKQTIWTKKFNNTEYLNYVSVASYYISDTSVSSSNFTITDINNYNSQAINNFSALINGTLYNTTTGSINTPYLNIDDIVVNITIISNNMFNKTYSNYNVSSNLIAYQDQFPLIVFRNVFDNSDILTNGSFEVVGYTNLSYVNGQGFIPLDEFSRVIINNITNYIPISTMIYLQKNNLYYINISQSIILLELREFDSNLSFSNFSVNISGFSNLINVSGFNTTLYLNSNVYNVSSVVDNKGQELYVLATNNFTVNYLDNKTIPLYVFDHNINVSARSILGNVSISNFSVYINDTTDFTDNRVFYGINGSVLIPVIHHNYTVTIVEAPGFSVFDSLGNYNLTANFSINSNVNVTFYLYEYNSVNFSFFDVAYPSVLLDTLNISLSLVFNGNSFNYTISSGYIFVDNLSTGNWEARYSVVGYNPNNYFFTILDSSTQRINLYVQNSSLTTLFKVLLRDQNDGVVSGNIIRLQKQFDSLGGQFITIRECETNDIGVCYMYIQEGIDLNYRFVVIDTSGNMIKTTESSPIITLPSEDKVITIRVNTGENLVEPIQRLIGVYGLISLNNNVSTFDFIDGLNAISGGCLKVSQRYYDTQSSYSLINYSCISGTSGTINFNYSFYLVNDTSLLFEGFVNYTDYEALIYTLPLENKIHPKNSTEEDNLFFLALFFLFISFATLWIPNIFIQILINFGCILSIVLLGFTLLGVPVIMSFMALGIFIHWDRKSSRGFI